MSKRVSFFIARYSYSGVPLAQIRLAKALRRRGYQVEFVIGYISENMTEPQIEGIKVVSFNKPRTYKLILPILSYIKQRRPDVVFTAEDHLNAIVTVALILARSKAKLSASSRVTPYDTYSNNIFSKRWVLKQFSIVLQKRIDALVCVSEDMVGQYKAIFGPTRHQCIYNVVCDSEMPERIVEHIDDPWLNDVTVPVVITAGRLAPEKGFPDLIDAMGILLEDTTACLMILGEGPLRHDLEKQIRDKGLSSSIRLLGFQKNPLKFFNRSKVFVLSSYVEGLPNVLVEAMACGCTPVSTDCPTGPREVLHDGKYGYIVPTHDPKSMAGAIKSALENPISSEAIEEIVKPFTEDEVVKKHQEVLGF